MEVLNLIIGQYENGQYFPYVPESAVKADAISQLADGQAAGQAIGGDALPPIWAFNPWWLAALVPLIGIPAVAISGGGGGGGHSKVVDHAPIAGDDSAHAKHNTPVAIHVTANDSDVDGDLNPNSIRIVNEGSKGTVAIGKDGKIIYTPNKGEYGVDTVTYVVKDKAGHESNVATITINIDAAPEAKDDTAATKESKPVTIDMENNYSDKDGDVDHSSLEIRTNGGKGFAKFVNGKLVYQPNKGEVGTDTITYTVTDKNGNVSEDATITINIDAPPVANDDSAKANKATPVELDVLVNDTDLDGDIDPTTLEVVGEPTKGTVKVVDGKLVYTANPEATGQDTITYLVKDKNGNVSNKATVTIDITEPPVANKDEAETRHNTPVEIDITANDTDRDGDLDKSSVVITHPGTKGTVTIGENGKLTYTPNPGEHGTDTITYQIKDKAGNISNEATITVKIDAAPVATNDKTDTRHNTPVEIDITANDTDTDGDLDKNSVLITQPGSKGTVTIGEDGKLTYTPNKGATGTDTITYTVKDKHGNISNEATVTIEIDTPPIAEDDKAHAHHNEIITIDVLANGDDADKDLDPSSVTIVDGGNKGTVTIGEDGKLTYTPNKGEHGTDTITYTVKDKHGNISNEATVTIEIDAPPIAEDDKAHAHHNEIITIDVLANDDDADKDLDPSSVTIVDGGNKGSVTIGQDGKLIYTPKPGATGTDTITYTVKDKHGNISNEATVTIEIDAPPIAEDDKAHAHHNEIITIDVLANDDDADKDLDPSSVTIVDGGSKGSVTIGQDGKLIYTPKPGATGTDTITYTVKDKHGNISNEATVTIEIDAPPIAEDDKAHAHHNEIITIDVLANDDDADKDLDPSSVTIVDGGNKGSVTIGQDGKLIYTPKPGATGTDTITYTVKDKHGNISNEATVTIEIDAPPIAEDDKAHAHHNEIITIDVLANDDDADKDLDPSSVTIVDGGSKGSVTIGQDGKLIYTPKPGATGTDTITYTVKDKHGNISNEAIVTIEIDAAPVATPDSGITLKDTPVTVDLSDNISDLDGDADLSTLEIVANGNKGTATIDANGKLTYTPNLGVTGTDTITYKVLDKNGNVSNTATVTLSIKESGTEAVDVFEKGLRTDGTAGSSAIVADGVVILANPDDKPVAEQDIQITKPTTELTSGGKPITWESTDNGFVGKDAGGNEVITLTTNSSTENGQTKVGYEVTLKGLVDHPVGKESLKVEFGVKNGNDEVKTEIVVHDDKPEAANVGLSVEPPSENTFYANVVISLDFSGSMWERDSGLPDVIDPVDQYGRPQQMFRYDAALNAIDTLLDSYQERLDSATKGDVRVSLNGFADKAVAIGGSLAYSDGNAYWCTLDEAKEIVEALRVERWHPPFKKDVDKGGIGGSTNYDASLQQILSIYKNKPNAGEPVKEPTVDNTFFFISDGAPSVNNDGSSNGIEAKSRPDFEAGNAGHDIGEDKWTEFLAENGIRSVAIGIGQDMVPVEGRLSGEDHLKPIAFDGQKGANNDANDVIVLKDMSSLGNILSKYVPNENTIESNFAEGSDGKTTLSFGADGKSSISIDVDGVTYTYDANKGTITSNGTDKSKWADFGEGEVAIKTDAGGLLSISLGDKNFGHLTYRPGATRPTGMTEEKFTLTLTDKDGTSSKPTITVDISKLKESGNTGLNDTDLTALKLFSPESAMELHGVDTDVNATSSHSTGFMNSSLDALQETQHAMI
ncbi:Ig-like domain-containing protein [Providencia rustigianii]|uniref:Ig-like domain-containing protein n=1 Tax=Providencia rustigianii TaxID=158850 RepID=UPI000D9AADAF|nr:Ig-like domain-containing protein [Providencia rustigianii]SPY76660.1 Predicted integral membrane protein linked to a cation pump [Providencia rustigianii]